MTAVLASCAIRDDHVEVASDQVRPSKKVGGVELAGVKHDLGHGDGSARYASAPQLLVVSI